jgi:hypothetical protein
MRHDGRPMNSSIGNMSAASEISIASPRRSASDLPMDSHLDQSTASHDFRHSAYLPVDVEQDQPVSPGISHSLKTSGRLQRSHFIPAGPVDYDTSSSSHGSQSLQTSMSNKNENENSLRRSTSQRVIGFFSDLLRTSTSCRSGSDQVQTHTTDRSVSQGDGAEGNDLGVEEWSAEAEEEHEEYEDHDEYEKEESQLDNRQSCWNLGQSHLQ